MRAQRPKCTSRSYAGRSPEDHGAVPSKQRVRAASFDLEPGCQGPHGEAGHGCSSTRIRDDSSHLRFDE